MKKISRIQDLIDAIDEACDGYRNEFFRGAAPAGDLASVVDVVGVRNDGGRIVLDLQDPRHDEDLKDVYIRDCDRPDVESPAEAVQAAREFFVRIGARVVAYGEPRRNDEERRWEVPVSTRPLPEPREIPRVLQIPAKDWKPSGWVQLEGSRIGAAECFCCGKPSRELIMMILEHYDPSRRVSHRDAYQVDIEHYARRKGITTKQARVDVEVAIEAERNRVRAGRVAKEPVHGRGWGLYGPEGEPLLRQDVFPSRAKGEAFLADLLKLLKTPDYTAGKIQELIERHDGRHVYDLILQSLPAPDAGVISA